MGMGLQASTAALSGPRAPPSGRLRPRAQVGLLGVCGVQTRAWSLEGSAPAGFLGMEAHNASIMLAATQTTVGLPEVPSRAPSPST